MGRMGLDKAKRVTVAEWTAGEIGPVVGIDFETFYSSTYSVSQMGNWAYVHDPRFKAWAVSVSDGARTCVCTPAEFPWETIAGREWVSHNREFDEAVWRRLKTEGCRLKGDFRDQISDFKEQRSTVSNYGDGPSKWWCSAAACAFLQLPRDLAGACRAVFGIEVDKAVRRKSKGRDGQNGRNGQLGLGIEEVLTGEQLEYAATDAEMSLALWQVLEKHWPVHERRLGTE